MRIPYTWKTGLGPYGAAVLSGALFASAFPPLAWSQAAWVAWLPLLWAVRGVSIRKAAALAYVAGAVGWLAGLFWVTRVTAAGWVGLSLYCALYVAPFGAVAARLSRPGPDSLGGRLLALVALPLVWVGGEYLRGVLFTGFPWLTVGSSQFQQIALIQHAAWGGMYAVSAVVMLGNAALAGLLSAWKRGQSRWVYWGALLAIAASWVGGERLSRGADGEGKPLRIALIQPGIPQLEKWSEEHVAMIRGRLTRLTEAALRVPGLDLVVWPETAVPDFIRDSAPDFEMVRALATNGVPLLVGTMDYALPDDGQTVYLNSSMLFDRRGAVVDVYDKQHLVLFGEYVPFRETLPFLSALTPIGESFTGGDTGTVFRLPASDAPFSVLICFEDALPYLARDAVRNGARLLVNQTNDAWFDPLAGSRQHLAQSVFRCVENRVPGVRAANTGVTCAIDDRGRIRERLSGPDGEHTRDAGLLIVQVAVRGSTFRPTLYTRWGDLFGVSCAVLGCGLSLLLLGLPEGATRRARADDAGSDGEGAR